jgi:hypothetical protein
MSRAAQRPHPSLGYWAFRLLILLPVGLLVLFVVVFGLLESDMHPIDKAIGSSTLGFFSLICLYPVLEAIRLNVFHRRKMIVDAMSDEARRAAPRGQGVDWNRLGWKRYVIVAVLCLFLAPLLGRGNGYSFSRAVLFIMWLVVFPAILLLYACLTRHVHYQKHAVKIWLLTSFFFAFVVVMLLFHVDVAMDWLNAEPISMSVRIREVSHDSCAGRACLGAFLLCEKRAHISDDTGRLRSFCVDKLKHNLVSGRSQYAADDELQVFGRRSWAGVVVDSVVWKRTTKAKGSS